MFRLLLRFSALVFLGTTTTLLAQNATPSFELHRDTEFSNTRQNLILQGSSGISDLATGDFNNDGKLDLVYGGGETQSSITLRLGNGDGTFQAPVTVGLSQYYSVTQIAVADVNNDGKLDLVVSGYNFPEYTGGFQVFLGNGDGTFQAPMTYATTYAPSYVAVRDFNGDGLADVAAGITGSNGDIEFWNNQGDGTFALTKTVTPVPHDLVSDLRAGQFGGNGINDLVFDDGRSLYALWNDGHENFSLALLATYPLIADVNVGALNMDGRDDILVSWTANSDQGDSIPGSIDVYYGQGGQQLLKRTVVTYSHTIYNSGFVALWAVDVNGDGIGDIAAEPEPTSRSDNAPSGLYVWLGNPDGSFSQTPLQYVPTTHGAGSLAPGDFNRDGMMDFAQTLPNDNEMEIYINGGNHAPCSQYRINPAVTACQPVDHTYLPSPVTVEASAYDTHQVTAMQEYVDGTLDYSADVTSFTKPFTLGPGAHFLVTKAWDYTGLNFVSDRTITVYKGTPGPACPVGAVGSAAICLPSGATGSSPVTVLANGWTANVPTAAQLYVDGNLVVNDQACDANGENCDGGTSYVQTTQSLSSGKHDLVFKLWDNLGNVTTAEKTVTVQ